MPSFPILEFTDGTKVVSMLGPFFKVESRRMTLVQAKGGGTWQSSPLADGRRLVNRRFGNAIETIELSASATTQNSWAHQLQELERLMEKAVEYWASASQNTPVYWVDKADCETNKRHALVYFYSIPSLNEILRTPFASEKPAMVKFSISIERGHWLADPPGDETCVEISGMGADGHETDAIFSPALDTDDAEDNGGIFSTAGADIIIGDIGGADLDAGIVFRDVTIPRGSIITGAFVRFKAAAADAGAPAYLIQCQDSDTAQAFSTLADFNARPLTGSSAAWGPGAWVLGVLYDTSSIIAPVQEVISRAGWESGNSLAVMVLNNASPANIHREFYAMPHAVEPAAALHITYISADGAGRSATCDPEVYIANKHNYRGLTHVWYDEAGVGFSANLLGTALPQTLFPAVPSQGDILYFGIESGVISTITGGGPFFSLVFDLATAQDDLVFANGWEYSRGAAAWGTLTVMDNTDTAEPLDTAGVNSVFWEENILFAPDAINGVTGYWVRLEITNIPAAPVAPVQQNRDIYTVNWPYVEIDGGQVEGDVTALLRALLENRGFYSPDASIVRVVMGLRSNSRGLDFSAYLNCSDQQEIPGINTVVQVPTAFATSVLAPTERVARFTPVGAVAMSRRCWWLFNTTPGATPIVSNQWYGSYHAFVRVSQTGGAPENFSIQLFNRSGDHFYSSSAGPVVVPGTDPMEVIDLGRIDIPDGTGVLLPTDRLAINLQLHGSALAGGGGEELDFFDLILIPTDEMIVDARVVTLDESDGWIVEDYTVSIDSVLFPKSPIRTLAQNSDSIVEAMWRTSGALAFLQSNRDQRLWFFLMGWDVNWLSRITLSARVQAFANRRYLSLRGER